MPGSFKGLRLGSTLCRGRCVRRGVRRRAGGGVGYSGGVLMRCVGDWGREGGWDEKEVREMMLMDGGDETKRARVITMCWGIKRGWFGTWGCCLWDCCVRDGVRKMWCTRWVWQMLTRMVVLDVRSWFDNNRSNSDCESDLKQLMKTRFFCISLTIIGAHCYVPRDFGSLRSPNSNSKGQANPTQVITHNGTYDRGFEYQVMARTWTLINHINTANSTISHYLLVSDPSCTKKNISP